MFPRKQIRPSFAVSCLGGLHGMEAQEAYNFSWYVWGFQHRQKEPSKTGGAATACSFLLSQIIFYLYHHSHTLWPWMVSQLRQWSLLEPRMFLPALGNPEFPMHFPFPPSLMSTQTGIYCVASANLLLLQEWLLRALMNGAVVLVLVIFQYVHDIWASEWVRSYHISHCMCTMSLWKPPETSPCR